MRRIFFPALLSLFLLPLLPALQAGAAEEGTERLLFVSPPKWREVYSGREENLSTTEYIPDADKADEWTEMLSVQIVLGRGEADPEKILANVAIHEARNCHEFDAKPIELGGTGSYPTLGMMMLCGAHAESRGGEFSLLRGIAGKDNFYLLRKTWRTETFIIADDPPVELDDRKFWLGFLAYLRICDESEGTCPNAVTGD